MYTYSSSKINIFFQILMCRYPFHYAKTLVAKGIFDDNINFMNVYNLRLYCKRHKITGYSFLNRNELIKKIIEHRKKLLFDEIKNCSSLYPELERMIFEYVNVNDDNFKCRYLEIKRCQKIRATHFLINNYRKACKNTLINWFKINNYNDNILHILTQLTKKQIGAIYIAEQAKIKYLSKDLRETYESRRSILSWLRHLRFGKTGLICYINLQFDELRQNFCKFIEELVDLYPDLYSKEEINFILNQKKKLNNHIQIQ